MNACDSDICRFYQTFYYLTMSGGALVLSYFALNEFSVQSFLYKYVSRLERYEMLESLEDFREHVAETVGSSLVEPDTSSAFEQTKEEPEKQPDVESIESYERKPNKWVRFKFY
jgi:hypothetical protein